MSSSLRDKVFVSYSHQDSEWLNKILTMLAPLIRSNAINVWSDTKIKPGAKWREEIKKALETAKVAVLLVSPNFLASDFIAEHELPEFLSATDNQELIILWVAISHSLYKETQIAMFQAVNDPSHPLDSLTSPELNQALVRICEQIKKAFQL